MLAATDSLSGIDRGSSGPNGWIALIVFGSSDETLGETFPDDLVGRQEHPPVGPPSDSSRMKSGQLTQLGCPFVGRGDAPFEPRRTGDFHLGSEPQQSGSFVGLHTKEVQRVTDS